jgi:CSLREA domain-containing protein
MIKRIAHQKLYWLLIAWWLLAAMPGEALALNLNVNSTADASDANPGNGVCATLSGVCTLRAAIEETNASPGEDVINVPPNLFNLNLGALVVRDHVRILGTPFAATVIDGQGDDRVLWIDGSRRPLGIRVELHHLTIRDGNTTGNGGGILNDGGRLLVNRSRIIGNRAMGNGAGIRNASGSILSLVRSTIDDNGDPLNPNGAGDPISLPARAGGLDNAGIAYLDMSTISRNRANRFGGLLNTGILIARNSTISGNLGDVETGGMVNTGLVYLNNVTIANNQMVGTSDLVEDSAGGVQNIGTIFLANTIIAGNTRPLPEQQDCFGTLQSVGYNLIGDPAGCTVAGVQTGVILGEDSLLSALTNNGGDTETHALPAGSPAVNAGNPATPNGVGTACESVDQRFRLRGVGPNVGRCDMGAFERNAGPGQEGNP